VLFDPVFEDRCSPFSFMGPRRFTEPPCAVGDIPAVDAVLISHSHYDHLSHGSVLEVQRRHPDAQFFVGLGLASWFRKAGLRNVTELDWWEDAELRVKVRNPNKPGNGSGNGTGEGDEEIIKATVSSLPAQHTSARTPFDKDTTLWCSWAVQSGGKSVWFGGDTGYRAVPDVGRGIDDYGPEYESLPRCPQFEQIGRLRGPFDLGLIPIGAYHPRAVFSSMHANPFDSVEIFADTRCRRAMGIHWGTWALTLEEVLEPPVLLREALRRKGFEQTGVFDVCDIGASVEIE
jgi:N-acyl-phosphatidylethanolamine-hydrolysing phospholipase D